MSCFCPGLVQRQQLDADTHFQVPEDRDKDEVAHTRALPDPALVAIFWEDTDMACSHLHVSLRQEEALEKRR